MAIALRLLEVPVLIASPSRSGRKVFTFKNQCVRKNYRCRREQSSREYTCMLVTFEYKTRSLAQVVQTGLVSARANASTILWHGRTDVRRTWRRLVTVIVSILFKCINLCIDLTHCGDPSLILYSACSIQVQRLNYLGNRA